MNERRKKYCRKLNEILAPNVKKYREKIGMSQKELSILIGKPQNYIKNLEELKYIKVPEFHIIVYFCSIFNIKINDLLPQETVKKITKEVGYNFDADSVK